MTESGYGQFSGPKNKHWLAHRLVWGLLGGGLPEDLHHDCEFKHCVRPKHLDPLTKAEHTKEHARERERTECVRGHAFTETNTYWRVDRNGNRSRQCRRCKADRERERVRRMTPVEREARERADAERRRQRNGWRKQSGSRY